ncbi:MAG: DUF350 domain-containing protein [Candidatus Pacebacteria bacterium]|nr:DUF350 domain-containing protein [Candidatus Paceibacterota bacterium]
MILNLATLLQSLVFSAGEIAAMIGVLFVAKLLVDLFTQVEYDEEIEGRSNLAVALHRAGFFAGIGIGLLATVSDASGHFWKSIALMFWDGANIAFMMLIAKFVLDQVIIPGVQNTREILDGNLSVAWVEFGGYIATGLIAYGAVSGEGGGLLSSYVFFVLGQVALVIVTVLFEKFTPFNLIKEIHEGNVSAGVMLCGILISLGVVLEASLSGPFVGWTTDIFSFVVYAGVGLVFLWAIYLAVDKLFLPNTTMTVEIQRDRNVGASALTATMMVVCSLVVAHAAL